jgi:hypothetical protein
MFDRMMVELNQPRLRNRAPEIAGRRTFASEAHIVAGSTSVPALMVLIVPQSRYLIPSPPNHRQPGR